MALRFEFDSTNRILLIRVDGRLIDESLAKLYEKSRKYSVATYAAIGFVDFSSVTEFAVSNEIIRKLADQEPAMLNPTTRPRILVAPQTPAFGLLRMFQITGEGTRPLLKVVHAVGEAFAALGIQSPRFESLK